MRTHSFRGVLVLAVLLTWTAAPAFAQSIVRGTVVDANGQPVDGATVLFEAEGTTRRMETKTNRNGEFLQIGLTSGAYKVTASKDGVGTHTLTTQVMQRENQPLSFRITPAAASPAEVNKEALAIQAAAGSALDAMKAGRYDEAIASFNEVLLKVPTCAECYYNIGLAHSNKREFSDAEAAFNKAIELDPKSADAYTGLANIYNAQRKFDEAAQASAKAAELAGGGAGGANAEAVYNQGVIHWNAGRFEEAKAQFEAAVQADPRMAMAYYQLGMANLNLGQIPAAREAFEKYLEVEPNGPKSAEVKAFVQQLPQ